MSGPFPLSRRHTNPGRVSKKQRTLVRPKAKKQYPFAAALRGGSYATGLLLNVLNFRLHKTNSSSVWKLMLQMYGICSRLPNISAVFFNHSSYLSFDGDKTWQPVSSCTLKRYMSGVSRVHKGEAPALTQKHFQQSVILYQLGTKILFLNPHLTF